LKSGRRELGANLEHVTSVVLRRTEALDTGIETDHGAGHGFAGGILIKAAVNGMAFAKECGQPARIGSSAGKLRAL
jgi:hypothetical protein